MENRLRAIQKKLADLKNDRTKYLSVAYVLELYIEFSNALVGFGPDELAKSGPLINDTLLMFSLAFITSGHTREPIAVYAKLVTLLALYQFIYTDPAVTPKELNLLEASVQHAQAGPQESGDIIIPPVTYLDEQIQEILGRIRGFAAKTSATMATLPEEEFPLNSQITHLRRGVLAEVVSPEFSKKRLKALHNKFVMIRAHISHSDQSISAVLDSQCQITQKLIDWFGNGVSAEDIESEDADLLPVFRRLRETLPELDVFIMTRRWTLRATDLYQHMKYLQSILPKLLVVSDDTDEDGRSVSLPQGDDSKYLYLVTYMARRAWVQVFKLLETTEPVSEALSSLYNQLLTMKRCLNEVQLAGGISSLRELYPYQMKLASLDDSRFDGKFVVHGEVPPGQGILNGMLAECFDLVYELKVELDERGEEDADDSHTTGERMSDDTNGLAYLSNSDIEDDEVSVGV